jgi:hypothetical protein
MLIILMYTISLNILPSFKLNIHNQCSNVDLVSPTYDAGYNLECYRAPGHIVYVGDMMRSSFAIKSDHIRYGVLMYRLQRNQSHEITTIGKDTSSAVHILILWKGSKSEGLYADILLAEYDKGFDWSRHNLESLHHKNRNRLNQYSVPVVETWLLNDNTALMTTLEIMNEDHLLNITVSEVDRYNYARTPVYIDLQR